MYTGLCRPARPDWEGAVHAPEQAADLYSFGVLLWEMVCGVRAWENLSQPQVMIAVSCQGRQLEFPHKCPAELARFAPKFHAPPLLPRSFARFSDGLSRKQDHHAKAAADWTCIFAALR